MTTPNLIEALKLTELEPEQQAEILENIGDIVAEGTLVRLVEQMDDATADEFKKLLDSDAPEEQVDAFIKLHVPDSDKALQDTLDELRDDILAVTSK